jgi:hypothetical protein
MSLNYVVIPSAAVNASLVIGFYTDLQTVRSPNIFLWALVTLCQIGLNSAHQFAQRFKASFAKHFGGSFPGESREEI